MLGFGLFYGFSTTVSGLGGVGYHLVGQSEESH